MDDSSALKVLSAAGVAYRLHRYEPPPLRADDGLTYGQRAARILGVEPARLGKTLVVRRRGDIVVLVLPVDQRAKGVQLVDAKVVQDLTGYLPGGVSPIGMRTALPTMIDEALMRQSSIIVSAGAPGLSVELTPQALRALCAPVE